MDLQKRLDEAEKAYHDLMSGQAVVEFRDQNGELVRYQAANAYRLSTYIHDLRRQLNGGLSSRPMRLWGR